MPARISSTAFAGARYLSPSLIFRRGQGASVQLAVDRQRQRVQHHHRRRHHVGRQPLGQCGAHLGRVGGPGDIAHQALVAGTVLADDHRRLIHPVQPGQRCLDLTQFDAIAADLDLLIGAAQVLQLPIGTPAHQIPGAIHPRPGPPERARHKPRRRQIRTAAIYPAATPRRPHTTHRPHPAGTGRNHPSSTKKARCANGTPMGLTSAAGVAIADLPERGMHRRLGDAVHVDHRGSPGWLRSHVEGVAAQALPRRRPPSEASAAAQLGLQRVSGLQRIERRGGLAEDADLFGDQQRMQVFG